MCWIGLRDEWWYEIIYDDKIWEYRLWLLPGWLGAWFFVRCSFAVLPGRSTSRRVQKIVGAIRFDGRSNAEHTDASVYRPEHGYLGVDRDKRTAFQIGKVIAFHQHDWWEISYTNVCHAVLPVDPRYGFTDEDVARGCRMIRRGIERPGRVVEIEALN